MSPTAVESSMPSAGVNNTAHVKPQLVRVDANDSDLTTEAIVDIIKRDSGIIIKNFISKQLAAKIQREVSPHLDHSGYSDQKGFFPKTTASIMGLIGKSPACVDLATVPLGIDITNAILTSTYTYRIGKELKTVSAKPILSSTAAFRINPGSADQVLHRDDADFHPTNDQLPIMIGFMTALTRTTAANGATRVIPGSHKWGIDQIPEDKDAVQAELDPTDCFVFLGNAFHGGGANTTEDESRETVGIFYNKAYIRPAENFLLQVPIQQAAQLSPQVLRLLGYGVSYPGLGLYEYGDPLEVIFRIDDEEVKGRGQ